VALGSHWGGFGVALEWLWGAYRLAINRLWGGFDDALRWLEGMKKEEGRMKNGGRKMPATTPAAERQPDTKKCINPLQTKGVS
jgi:hypothetical protein